MASDGFDFVRDGPNWIMASVSVASFAATVWFARSTGRETAVIMRDSVNALRLAARDHAEATKPPPPRFGA